MDLKQLKKLASACRKAGIKHFKSADYEFTLTDDMPSYKPTKGSEASSMTNGPVETDMLTDADLLFWSSGAPGTDEEGPST